MWHSAVLHGIIFTQMLTVGFIQKMLLCPVLTLSCFSAGHTELFDVSTKCRFTVYAYADDTLASELLNVVDRFVRCVIENDTGTNF